MTTPAAAPGPERIEINTRLTREIRGPGGEVLIVKDSNGSTSHTLPLIPEQEQDRAEPVTTARGTVKSATLSGGPVRT